MNIGKICVCGGILSSVVMGVGGKYFCERCGNEVNPDEPVRVVVVPRGVNPNIAGPTSSGNGSFYVGSLLDSSTGTAS